MRMIREETNNFAYEDVLRELELLPVWKLRVLASLPSAEVRQKIAEVETADKAEVNVAEVSHYILVSEDKNWAFVLPDALTGKEQALFNNILLALQVNKTQTETLVNLTKVKVIVVMGETIAQWLLKSSDSLEQLRSKAHVFENVALIVTYHPNDLLQHLPNKAKMWDDLCIANKLVTT